jgi:hypothetical protein
VTSYRNDLAKGWEERSIPHDFFCTIKSASKS